MKKQVAQFVPYTDTLGDKINTVPKDGDGFLNNAIAPNGKIYTRLKAYIEPVEDSDIRYDTRTTVNVTWKRDGKTITAKQAYEYLSKNTYMLIPVRLYVGQFEQADYSEYYDAIAIVQPVNNNMVNANVSSTVSATGVVTVTGDPTLFAVNPDVSNGVYRAIPFSVGVVYYESGDQYFSRGTSLSDV